MVAGEVMCIGSAMHLKRKFGSHLQVDMVVERADQASSVARWMMETVPRCELVEASETRMRFSVLKTPDMSQARLFEIMHGQHGQPIVELAISTISLEQIFIDIARNGRLQQNALYVPMASLTA